MPNKPKKIDLDDINSRKVDENLLNELRELFEKAEEQKERYDFTWSGKAKAYFEAASPTTKTLCPQPEESMNFENSENLFITGDNLETLKLLQESYLSKIDMIYIDPPYNTGNDFVYHDNFKSSSKEADLAEGNVDEEGNRLVKTNKSSSRYHSDWLTMMYPRLKLARNLLSENGSIFVSIDDNEQANLKLLMDEIFGFDNFIGTLIWKKKGTSTNVKGAQLSSLTEYIIVYARNIKNKPLNSRITYASEKKYPYADQEGRYRTQIIEKKSTGDYDRKSMKFEIMGYAPRKGKRWQIGIEKARELESKNRFIYEEGKIKQKVYDFEDKDSYSANPNLLLDMGSTQSGQDYVDELMNGAYFDTPKPVELIKHLIKMSTKTNPIIMDFFAGSGTTADAVMQLNVEDKNNRKFIVSTLDEKVSNKSEAYKAGYQTIDQLSRERIRRSALKIGYASGFRAMKVDKTGLKEDVFKTANTLEQSQLVMDIDIESTKQSNYDLLYDVLVESGLEYNKRICIETIYDEKIIKYDYFGELSGVIGYFDKNITDDLIRNIAKLKPLIAVFKESAFSKSAQKVNIMEQFRIISPDTKVKVI
ncbi:site-specific DNA-methyltransferase [Staphylococcus xylosus]